MSSCAGGGPDAKPIIAVVLATICIVYPEAAANAQAHVLRTLARLADLAAQSISNFKKK
jgi:hypothetical protein